ncbi:MAG: FxsA family protein [Actinomycetota bacterium]|nr:FxsA family protein [Actinomycetota bacterium]
MSVVLAVVVVIGVELYVLIEVARVVGVAPAILALLLISASGPWLVRRAGFGVWRRTQQRLAAGELPGREALDGVVLLAAGLLVCIPGFVTDVVGLLLMVPPVRALAGRVVAGRLVHRAAKLSPVLDVGSHSPDPPLQPGDPPPHR